MPLDPAVIRDNLLDYGARTFWALVVALITLLVARRVRGATMRMLARNRAQANVTILLGNLAHPATITAGILPNVPIYTREDYGCILTGFSVVNQAIHPSLQDILKNLFDGGGVLVE